MPSRDDQRTDVLLDDVQQACAKLLAGRVRIFLALGLTSEAEWNDEAILERIADAQAEIRRLRGDLAVIHEAAESLARKCVAAVRGPR